MARPIVADDRIKLVAALALSYTMVRVLVTGATGQQGGGTVDALLLKTGVEVFALSRTPDSAGALALQKKGVKVVKGDFNDKASLEAALRESKCSRVFLVTDFWQAAKQKKEIEILHGCNMVDAVKAVDPSSSCIPAWATQTARPSRCITFAPRRASRSTWPRRSTRGRSSARLPSSRTLTRLR